MTGGGAESTRDLGKRRELWTGYVSYEEKPGPPMYRVRQIIDHLIQNSSTCQVSCAMGSGELTKGFMWTIIA